jgi:hypothetical protein
MAKPSSSPTQDFIPISEIRDGIVVLKNGTVRGVLLVSAVNLALKSTDEQEATMSAFQNYLNTLDFSTQIVVQSRKYDILPYLEILEERLKDINEDLLRIQTRMYIEYVRAIAEQTNIMQKHFYVVVPYTGSATPTTNKSGLFGLFGKSISTGNTAEDSFMSKRSQLEQRMSVVTQGLSSMGLKVSALDSLQLTEMYYQLYNPGDTGKSFNYLLGQEPDRE